MNILTLYFSGTGNTKYIAEMFSEKMSGKCLSIEADVDFSQALKEHDIIAFCYPIYGSRVPRIMREFVQTYKSEIVDKKIIIFVTQLMFSGDGARVFTDMFPENILDVIYAEHFNMPNNICNTPLLRPASRKKIEKYKKSANKKILRICSDLRLGVVKKRGFSKVSELLGCVQGKAWQGDSKIQELQPSLELKAKNDVKIHEDCTTCGVCVKICPMKNLKVLDSKVEQQNNCIVCYRCVNRCPEKAITVLWHRKPKWQYRGMK